MKQINLTQLKGVLDVLQQVFMELDVDFYMIGAIAREYWYKQGNKKIPQTKDVDFAVFVASREIYEAVRERLKDHQFATARENAFVMISPEGIQVDLLPFGAISLDDGVTITGEGMTSIRINGFAEVYQAGIVEAKTDTGHKFKTATLPAIVLLKLIAYDDRPEKRQKDARDIASIIQHFFDLQSNLIYEHHQDLFASDQPERALEVIAAIVIGREIAKICLMNHTLKDRVWNIISTHIDKGYSNAFIQQMVSSTNIPADTMRDWLQGLKYGLAMN